MNDHRVIGIGETVLDILFKEDQPQKAVPGGSTFNSIVSLGRAGVNCAMVDAYMLIRSDSSALDIAAENYRIANLNYTAGVCTLSEVLQAHALLLQAQNAITDRRTSYIMARRRLADLQSKQF